MKKTLFLFSLLTLFGLNAASIDTSDPALTLDENNSSIYDENYSRRFIPYIKLGPEVTNLGKENTLLPGAGIGFRSESTTGAVDCCFSYSRVETKNNEVISHYITPKLSYLKYLNSHSPSAIFIGFGSAWMRVKNDTTNVNFKGLAGVASMGLERNRNSRIRQIFQVDINQPLLALKIGTSLPMPIIETSFSLGF